MFREQLLPSNTGVHNQSYDSDFIMNKRISIQINLIQAGGFSEHFEKHTSENRKWTRLSNYRCFTTVRLRWPTALYAVHL